MGVVWAAVNESIAREVALKLIRHPSEDLRRRLLLEARACGALKHRNVVEVYDVGETAEGNPFLVMQLLSGETVAELLKRQRRLDPPDAARIARDVALALIAAHGAGIIHRDLKPANIFLHDDDDADGTPLKTVKVLDFGVSKCLTDDGTVGIATATGFVGSPAYMSPEQAGKQGRLDPRADLWSLGVILFEMLTGERPFQGDDGELLDRIRSGPVPLVSRFVRHVDPGLVAVVSRCLERDLARRAQTAAEVAELLKPYCEVRLPAPKPMAIEEGDAATERLDPRALVALVHNTAPLQPPMAPPSERAAESPTIGLKQTVRMAPDHASAFAPPSPTAAANAGGAWPGPAAAPPALGTPAQSEPARGSISTMTPPVVSPPQLGIDTRSAALQMARARRRAGVVVAATAGVIATLIVVVASYRAVSRAPVAPAAAQILAPAETPPATMPAPTASESVVPDAGPGESRKEDPKPVQPAVKPTPAKPPVGAKPKPKKFIWGQMTPPKAKP